MDVDDKVGQVRRGHVDGIAQHQGSGRNGRLCEVTESEDGDLRRTFEQEEENAPRAGPTARGRDAKNHRRRVTSREVTAINGDVWLDRVLSMLNKRMGKPKNAG